MYDTRTISLTSSKLHAWDYVCLLFAFFYSELQPTNLHRQVQDLIVLEHLQRGDAFRTPRNGCERLFASLYGHILTARPFASGCAPSGVTHFYFATYLKTYKLLHINYTSRNLNYLLLDGPAPSLRPSLVCFSAACRAAARAQCAVASSSRHSRILSFAASSAFLSVSKESTNALCSAVLSSGVGSLGSLEDQSMFEESSSAAPPLYGVPSRR
jgi:hypothetical protein